MESIQFNISTGLTNEQRRALRARRARIVRARKIRRMKAIMTLIAIIATSIVLIASIVSRNNIEWTIDHVNSVDIEAGDTLWGLCDPPCPNEIDTRKYIRFVMDYNNLDSAEIYAGDKLEIPILVQVQKDK